LLFAKTIDIGSTLTYLKYSLVIVLLIFASSHFVSSKRAPLFIGLKND
jgi:hypothetical protein